MRILLALTAFLVSVNVNAFTQKADLDFTNLYGNTNAGHYEMSVTFSPKTTKSFSGIVFEQHRFDNEIICVSTAKFEVGQMLFTLTDKKTGWTFTKAKNVLATVARQSLNENCENDISKFVGTHPLYVGVNLEEAITLPARAPFDYQSVATYLAPFNGYLYIDTAIKLEGLQLAIDPSQILTEKAITTQNKTNASVTYYVFATKDSTTLSLDTGLIKF